MSTYPVSAYIRADLHMKPTEANGRQRPISSGYRCNCWIGARTDDGTPTYNDAVIYLESRESLEPGASGTVRIQPAFPDQWSQVDVGSLIEVCEGSRAVGSAKVLELFPIQ
jgi:hypothetical protein